MLAAVHPAVLQISKSALICQRGYYSFWFLGGQPEQPFYKSDLTPSIIAQLKRVPKVPTHRTKNQLRLGLPPFEDHRPGRHSGIFNVQHRRLRKLQHSHRAGRFRLMHAQA